MPYRIWLAACITYPGCNYLLLHLCSLLERNFLGARPMPSSPLYLPLLSLGPVTKLVLRKCSLNWIWQKIIVTSNKRWKKYKKIYNLNTLHIKTYVSTHIYFKTCYFTVRSLKGCNNNPKGSLALFSKTCVCGIFVKVHRNELQKI